MKRGSKIIVMLAAVVVLSVGYFVLNDIQSKEEAAKQNTAVIDRNQNDLQSVTISVSGEKTYTIEASGEGESRVYQLADYAPGFKFRQTAMENVFSKISIIDPEKIVDQNPSDLSVYGLKTPKSTVKTTYKDGTSDEIRIGNETPVGDGYYITINGDTVYRMGGNFGNIFTNNSYFFRDPDLIPAWDKPADVINDISLKKSGSAELFIKRYTQEEKDALKSAPASEFHMTKPTQSQLDGEYLQSNLLYPISRLYSDANVFEDNPQNTEIYGITKDCTRLTVSAKDGNYTILIGNRTPSYSGYYVMREGSSTVAEMPAEFIDQILSADPKKLAIS